MAHVDEELGDTEVNFIEKVAAKLILNLKKFCKSMDWCFKEKTGW